MGAAAQRRGDVMLRRQSDTQLAGVERSERCGGKYENGPDKAYGRCSRCASVDYEKYEGDRCTLIVYVTRR